MTEVLDIKYTEIIDWLKSRNLVPKEWTKPLKVVQQKLTDLVRRMEQFSDKEVAAYARQNREDFGYYQLEKAISLMIKSAEGQQKTMFGNYQSQLIEDSLSIEKQYRKDNLHLISLGKLLSQIAQYEIPGCAKNISMLEAQLKYAVTKTAEFENVIKHQQAEFENQCQKLGISGVALDKEIRALAAQLPKHFKLIQEAAQHPSVGQALRYYYDFTLYVNQKATYQKIQFPLLDALAKLGDVPAKLYEEKIAKGEQLSVEDQAAIDKQYLWYNSFSQKEATQNEEIDWNIEVNDGDAGGISWVIDDTTAAATVDTGSKDAAEPTISWDITEEDTNKNATNAATTQAAEDNSTDAKENIIEWAIEETTMPAQEQAQEAVIDWEISNLKQEEASQEHEPVETLLSSRAYRNILISNISEVIAFLGSRIAEIRSQSSNSILQTYETCAQEGLLDKKAEDITGLKDQLETLLTLLTNFTIRQLLLIKEQQKSCDRIIAQMNSYKENVSRCQQNIKDIAKKQIENEDQVGQYAKTRTSKVEIALELKDIVEKKLNESVKRKCVLTGDINKLKK